jgi:hypothetical protein
MKTIAIVVATLIVGISIGTAMGGAPRSASSARRAMRVVHSEWDVGH